MWRRAALNCEGTAVNSKEQRRKRMEGLGIELSSKGIEELGKEPPGKGIV